MSKIQFSYYEPNEDVVINYTTHAIALDEVLDDFANFLRGCGYQLDGLEQIYEE